MIITQIKGGLGNQLFQYAAARALSLQYQTQLALDTSSFDEQRLRNFELNAFKTHFDFAEPQQLITVERRGFFQKVRDNLAPYQFRRVFREKHFHFHRRFFNLPDGVYLKGYWQSEQYFAPANDVIRSELQLKESFVLPVQSFAEKLQSCNAVSVHIRRGDYTNPEILRVHGILPPDYYERAVAYFLQNDPSVSFFVFTDDPYWVKENIHIPGAFFVSGIETRNHYEDFYLMSKCRHHIIANSSFSWWAAWLNNAPGKKVVAPKNWFNEGPKDTQDLIPTGWTVL